ncbi:SEC65 [Malassezia furfur]|nr:SEC65 [Malassezia furfur]
MCSALTQFALPGVSSSQDVAMPSVDMMQEMMAQMGGGASAGAPSGANSNVRTMSRHTTPNVADGGEEDGPHKHWTSVYPMYLDAKQRYRKGCRRVAYDKAILYPNSQYISNAAKHLKLEYMHEPYRTHPRDWANPGRVKVRLYNDDGSAVRADIPTKQKLLEAIAANLQAVTGGKPPPLPTLSKPARASADTKDNTKAATSGTASGKQALRARERRIRRMQVPSTLPPHSPAMPAGMLSMDLSKMAGAAGAMPGMGPLGSMMSSMGLGDDDDEPAEEEKPAARQQPALGRRQRKRVVRIAR